MTRHILKLVFFSLIFEYIDCEMDTSQNNTPLDQNCKCVSLGSFFFYAQFSMHSIKLNTRLQTNYPSVKWKHENTHISCGIVDRGQCLHYVNNHKMDKLLQIILLQTTFSLCPLDFFFHLNRFYDNANWDALEFMRGLLGVLSRIIFILWQFNLNI